MSAARTRFTAPQRFLHWLMAVCILPMLFIGGWFDSGASSPIIVWTGLMVNGLFSPASGPFAPFLAGPLRFQMPDSPARHQG